MSTYQRVVAQPPDPNPKTPRLALPPGSIDTHIHLFGPAAQYPFHADSKYTSADALPETQIAQQDVLGLAGAVIISGGGYGQSTRHLEDTLARFPARFRGVALLPDDATPADVDRLKALGVRGARFVGEGHRGALPRLDTRVAAMIADFGWHAQFYPGPGELHRYVDMLRTLPTDIVLDHFACIDASLGVDQPEFAALLELIDSGRVWVKLSGPMRCTPGDFPYAPVTPIARALVAHAPERLLWGSDWPHVNMNGRGMPNDGDLVDLIGEWIDDDATLRTILVDNPRTVYGAFGKDVDI